MPWLITFEDEPSRLALRTTHIDQHIAYVRSIEHQILCSGGLRETPDSAQAGGMWLLDVPTKAEALALFQDDPFFKGGLRAQVRVRHWTRGVWEGRLGG